MGRIDNKMDQTIIMLNALVKRLEDREDNSTYEHSISTDVTTCKTNDDV